MDRNSKPNGILFKENPFKFQKKAEAPKQQSSSNFEMFFPSNLNRNVGDAHTNIAARPQEIAQQEEKNWNGREYYDASIYEIKIPIPIFINANTLKKLDAVMKDIQNQIDSYLNIPQLKQQIYQQIHKEFTQKNEVIINKYNQSNVAKKNEENKEEKKENSNNKYDDNNNNNKNYQVIYVRKTQPESQNRRNSGSALDNHVKQAQVEYAKDYKMQNPETVSVKSHVSDKQKIFGLISQYKRINKLDSENKLLGEFISQIMKQNNDNCQMLYNDIQKKQLKQESQPYQKKKENKYPYLCVLEDYSLQPSVIHQIAEKINPFGSDRCTGTQKTNSTLKIETIHFNFKKNKVLKTIVFSILHELLCKKNPDQAKKLIYQKLGFINQAVKGIEFENIILRQIYLHFLLIKLKDDNHYQNSIEFLKALFSYEFLVQLIFEHFLYSSQKDLKTKIPSENINEQLEQISKANNFDLILSDSQKNVKKCMSQSKKKNIQTPKIFIQFEQSFSQHSSQPVYFVLSPNDQLIAYV